MVDSFLIYHDRTVQYCVISVGDVTGVDDARCTNQLETAHKTMNKWLFHQIGFTRTSLSVTVTLVSNFVEENV